MTATYDRAPKGTWVVDYSNPVAIEVGVVDSDQLTGVGKSYRRGDELVRVPVDFDFTFVLLP
jgi:hypothetical protein